MKQLIHRKLKLGIKLLKSKNNEGIYFNNRVPANYDRTDAKGVIDSWNEATSKWKAERIFVSSFIFPSEGAVVSNTERNVNTGNVVAEKLKIVSVIIIKAIDHNSAIELAKACPILDQSGTVEVREVMPRF